MEGKRRKQGSMIQFMIQKVHFESVKTLKI